MSDADFRELCEKGSAQQIVDAIKDGANVHARDEYRGTPLLIMLMAWNNPNPEVITAFVNAGADVNAQSASGATPLIMAARNLNPKILAALLKAGADVNAKDEYGRTPLLGAAGWNDNPQVIAALIKAGADVNAKDDSGRTALMCAARWKPQISLNQGVFNVDVLTALVKAGADVNARDDRGRTALVWATVSQPQIAANIDTFNVGIAADKVRIPKVVMMLLELGADPKTKDSDGKMAINYARENENLQNTDALKKLEEVSR
jgi:ankyrin repeat protein